MTVLLLEWRIDISVWEYFSLSYSVLNSAANKTGSHKFGLLVPRRKWKIIHFINLGNVTGEVGSQHRALTAVFGLWDWPCESNAVAGFNCSFACSIARPLSSQRCLQKEGPPSILVSRNTSFTLLRICLFSNVFVPVKSHITWLAKIKRGQLDIAVLVFDFVVRRMRWGRAFSRLETDLLLFSGNNPLNVWYSWRYFYASDKASRASQQQL